MRAPYLLTSSLQAFQAEGSSGRRNARIRIKFVLVEQASADILAAKVFEREIRARSSGAKSIVLAFDKAMGEIAPQVIDWVLESVDAPRAPVVAVESDEEDEDESDEIEDIEDGDL